MIKLPNDIEEFRCRKKQKRIILFLLTEAAVLLITALFGERLFGALLDYSKVLYHSVVYLVRVAPVFAFLLSKQRKDKDFCGMITDVHVHTRSVHKSDLGNGRPNSAKFNTVNFVELTVEDDNGNVDFIEIDVGVAKPEHFLGDYQIGFKVYHFKGLNGYLVIDPERDDLAYCAVCHGRESSDKVRCNHCGHTLVRFGNDRKA